MVEIKIIIVVILLDFALISLSAIPMDLLPLHRFETSVMCVSRLGFSLEYALTEQHGSQFLLFPSHTKHTLTKRIGRYIYVPGVYGSHFFKPSQRQKRWKLA